MRWIDRIASFLRKQTGGKHPAVQDVGIPEVNLDRKQHLGEPVQSFVELKDPRDIELLIDALDDDEFDVWYHAGRGLVKLGGSSVPALLSSLQGTTRLRRRVIELLGDINDPRTIEPLLAILQGQNQAEVELSAKALGKMNIRNPDALAPLFKVFHSSNNRVIRSNLDKALLRMGDYAVEPLVELMNGPDLDLTNKAVLLLGRLKSELALKALVEHINDSQKGNRFNVVVALAEMNDAHAINPLIQLFTDTDWNVRETAVTALCKMGEMAVIPLKKVQKNDHEDPRVRAFAQEVLLNIQRKTPGIMKKGNNLGVIDIRSDSDEQSEVEERFPLDKENERIALQLSRLIKNMDKKGEYSAETKKEAEELGKFLCENGGNLRLHRIAARVASLGVSNCQLGGWWNGICGWIA
jgi:HEAT repeat protein